MAGLGRLALLRLLEHGVSSSRAGRGAKAARNRLDATFCFAPAALAVVDGQGVIVRANGAFASLVGCTEAQLPGRLLDDWVDDQHRPAARELLTTAAHGRVAGIEVDVRPERGAGFPAALSRAALGEEHAGQLVVQLQSVAAEKQKVEHLRRLAEADPVTGLWNRRRFEYEVERALEAAERGPRQVALIAIDLDGFKEVNDQHGHEAGNDLLRAVGEAVGEAAPDGAVGRLGGDEFAVLVHDTGADEAAALAEQISHAIGGARAVTPSGPLHTTASVGVALLPAEAETAGELFRRADLALYAAKATRAGSGRTEYPEPPRAKPPHPPVRVILCDDSEPSRRLLRERLEAAGRVEVVAEADTNAGLIPLAAAARPQVAIVDLGAGRDERVIEGLREAAPATKILELSGIERAQQDRLALAADGCCSKSAIFEELTTAIEELAAGSERPAIAPPAEADEAEVAWLGRVRRALAEDRFVLYAQPIISLTTGEVVQHELLLRMIGEDCQIIAPGRFLPVAERYGLSAQIDDWVVANGVRLAAAGAPVDINLSAEALADPDLGTRIERAIRQAEVDPRHIALEITETALARNEALAATFVSEMAALGCSVALDDFGTGYSGFAYLKRLPVDCLKIDREFVTDLLTSPASEQVIRAVVNLALGMGLRTVAEGIEDLPTLERLAALGVDEGQGYYIARPQPAAELLAAADPVMRRR